MARTIILSRSIGLTLAEAKDTLRSLGITGIRLRSAGRSTSRVPRIRRAPLVDTRGARFLRAERVAMLS